MAKMISSPYHLPAGSSIEVIHALQGGAGYDVESIGFTEDPSLVTGSFRVFPEVLPLSRGIRDSSVTAFTLRVAGLSDYQAGDIMKAKPSDVNTRTSSVCEALGAKMLGSRDTATAYATRRAFEEGLFCIEPLNAAQRTRLLAMPSFSGQIEGYRRQKDSCFGRYIDLALSGERDFNLESRVQESRWPDFQIPGSVLTKTRLILWWEMDRRTRVAEGLSRTTQSPKTR